MGMVDGKICLVTGGASNPGLGHAIAHKLASEGATVIVTDVDGEGAARTAAEIQEAGGQAQAWEQDVTDEAVWDSTMAQIRDEHGRLDALVNNAGIAILKTLPELSLADYNRQMLVNMTSVFLGTQKAVALMRETGVKGSIINMSSIVGVKGNAGQTNYAASKAGIIGFSKSVALELGSRDIRSNVIAPGFIETEMTGKLDEQTVQSWRDAIPLKRGGTPLDIANACVFLASDLSSYVTGQVINVDGGMLT